jgi:hypothetical protein
LHTDKDLRDCVSAIADLGGEAVRGSIFAASKEKSVAGASGL